MPAKALRTSDIARAVGAHPNTVRLYETWGFLPPIPRSDSGYRLFTPAHLDQMRLAWTALHGDIVAKHILAAVVKQAAAGDLGGALEGAYRYLSTIRGERAQAEAAVTFLERWSGGQAIDATLDAPLRIGEAAQRLGLTRDVLRNWERNGLISVPRAPRNGYRQYGPAEIARLRVLRMLRQAGYSLMAMLRMVRALDQGQTEDLRAVLDTPHPEEDIFSAADAWLSTLARCEQRGQAVIAQLEAMIDRRQPRT